MTFTVPHTFSPQITIVGHKFKRTGNSCLYKAMSLAKYNVLRLYEASLWLKVQMSHGCRHFSVNNTTVLRWSCDGFRSHYTSWIWYRVFSRSLPQSLQSKRDFNYQQLLFSYSHAFNVKVRWLTSSVTINICGLETPFTEYGIPAARPEE
jgi:hypothetical protein